MKAIDDCIQRSHIKETIDTYNKYKKDYLYQISALEKAEKKKELIKLKKEKEGLLKELKKNVAF